MKLWEVPALREVATLTGQVTVVTPRTTVTAGALPDTGGSSRLPWAASIVMLGALTAASLRLRRG